jgi:pyridoxal phosphate enzyme (YggS family)
MSTITERLNAFRATLPEGVALVAISKNHSVEMIEEAYAAGQRRFGENYILEMADKAARLPKDIEWHFTGHVQTNKLKHLAPFVHTIQSVDSWRLLSMIDRQAARHDKVINCLLQLHVAQEETKYGLSPDECFALLNEHPWRELKHVRITGLMAMASNTDDEQQVRSEFAHVRTCWKEVKQRFFADDDAFVTLSEGMTDDYLLAIAEGANMVRIGSAIFGARK